jgi:hypothetical protein
MNPASPGRRCETEVRTDSRKAEVRHLRAVCLAAASLLSLSIFACGSDGNGDGKANTGSEIRAATTAGSENGRKEITADDFDRSLFDDTSTTIDNKWVSYEPGKRFDWRGWTEEDGERIPHRIVFTVTDMTKVINGVRTVVGWDRDWSAGKLIESELIFLAQDKNGNVWHLGQYPEIYDEDGELVGGRPWLVGSLKGAKAGIHMKAEPRLGAPAYSQGFAPAPYNWDDWSKVYKVGRRTCVPADCYRNVLVIDEFEPTKPGAHQLKYYAPGVGNVRTGWRGTDPEKEVLVLNSVRRLGPKAMLRVRAVVRRHEERAYVYGRTPPAKPRGGG